MLHLEAAMLHLEVPILHLEALSSCHSIQADVCLHLKEAAHTVSVRLCRRTSNAGLFQGAVNLTTILIIPVRGH